tara:strand:+ start:1803 stop:2108 length:306 start_codon:yes stop_codon:yes gene_type:complete
MKKIYILIISIFLTSCETVKEAGKVLKNEKISTTDEFLVKKREPLVLPPNYEEVPRPGSLSGKKENDEEKIKEILRAPKTQGNLKSKSSSIEESILNRIGK